MKSSNRNIAPFITSKNLRYTALLSVAALGVFSGGQVLAAEATAPATATVIEPIGITAFGILDFGRFAAGTGGTVIVSTDGTRSKTDGANLSTIDSSPSAARFDVTGEESATYSVTWLGDVLMHTDGVTTMGLERISNNTGANAISGEVETGVLGAAGQSIFLGGILTVVAGQAAGVYSGDVTATVEYN